MHKKFLKNISLILFLNILIKPLWVLGIDLKVQNIVGVNEYGFYYSIMSFTFLLNILLDFGITNFNNRNIAQNNHLLRKHLSSILVLKLLLGVVYLIVSLLIAFFIGYSSRHFWFLIALTFNQFLIFLVMYLRSNLSGLHLFKIDSFVSVLDRIIMIGLSALFIWGNLPIKFSIKLYILIQTIGYLITAVIVLIIVFKKAKSRFLKLNWNLPFSLMIIKKSFPFAILVLLMGFYNRIDAVLLERMLRNGAEQSGIYASAYRLLDATNMIAFLFAGMLLPIFARMLKLKESVEELVKFSFVLLIIPALIISIGSFFYSTEIMGVLYKAHPEKSADVFQFLMFCFIPISTTYIFGTLLTANGNLKELNIMALCGMVFNVSLNFILIPRLEAVGASFASMLTQLFTALVQVLIAKRIFKFKFNTRLLSRLFVFIIGVIGINYLTHNFICVKFHLGWFTAFAIMGLASVLLSLAINLLSIKGILQILKSQ